MTLLELSRQLAARKITSRELVERSLAAIDDPDGEGARTFLQVHRDAAFATAARIDYERRKGASLPVLAGIPISIKDNFDEAGIVTRAGSKVLASAPAASADAVAVARLRAAGAVIIGRTNMTEFAYSGLGINPHYGTPRNVFDRAAARIPGGSSSGAAISISDGMAAGAIGTDTGGSTRIPAALNGLVGFKPTARRIPLDGVLPLSLTLDSAGPIARTVEDAALTLTAMAGPDRADATSSHEPLPDLAAALTGDIKGLRVGVPRTFVSEGVDADVKAAFDAALSVMQAAGASLVDVELPHAPYGVPAYYLVCTAEASSNLARYDGVKYGYRSPASANGLQAMYTRSRSEGFGAEVKRRIMLGTYVLSAGYYDAFYLKAQQVRTLLRRDYEQAFERADVIAMPTSPIPPFGIGEKADDPLQMYLADIFTVSANLAGLPAISIPCGLSEGLPVGLQLTARPFDEVTLLRAADAMERRLVMPRPDAGSL